MGTQKNHVTVLLYCGEKWPSTLGEERKVQIFENRIPRKIFVLEGGIVRSGYAGFYTMSIFVIYGTCLTLSGE
jgi:hypothetical protein